MSEAAERNSTDGDERLICVAAELLEANNAYLATYQPPAKTREEEEAREEEQDLLWAIVKLHARELAPLTPRTLAGAGAKARAAHALAVKYANGKLVAYDETEMLAMALIEDVIALTAERPA